jgi:glycosyltransferase involved in cell wall biosynthesis
MQRILINVRSQSAPLTGVQRYVREMCEQLAASVEEVGPHRHLAGVTGHLWEQSILPGRVRGSLLWSPANTGPLRVRNQVVTIHDLATLDHPEWFSPRFAAWYRWLIPRLVRTVRRVITVSQFSKARLLELTGIDEARIVVVPNGVNKRFFPRSADEIERVRRSLQIPTQRYVLSLGSIEPRKNLATLLQAWSRCHDRLENDITLVIAGARGETHVFRNAGLSEVPERVHFTGFVPDDALPALYGGALALIYPSIYEGFGLPVAEAMATGTVAIVANNTSLPEVVGDSGVKVDPKDADEIADALLTICGNESLCAALRERAIRESARFDWETSARLSLNVLGEAAA